MNLVWFVEEACALAGIPLHTWMELPQAEQIILIQNWQRHVDTKDDYVKRANFKPKETEMENVAQVIQYEDFAKLDIRVGIIQSAEALTKSTKLLKLSVFFGEEIGTRTIVAGIGTSFTPEALPGAQVVAIVNLAPRHLFGTDSHGMLLAAKNADGAINLVSCSGAEAGMSIG